MIEKQKIFTSDFLEAFDKLCKDFVEKIVPVAQFETPQQIVGEVDTSTTAPVPEEETSEKQIEDITKNSKIKEIAANVAEILSQVQDFTHKDKIINDLHKELMQYKNGLKESFNSPLLEAIMREYDRVNKQYRFYLEKSQAELQSELFNKLLSEFEMFSFALLNLLSDYDIEPFDFNVGDTHDIKLQKIVEVIETEDSKKDCTVAECVVCGFRNIETAKLFRHAKVKIYKLKNNSNINK